MNKISDEVIKFIEKTWRVELIGRRRSFAEAKIQRGILQGDALSPLLFIIAMMSLNHILRKCTAGYKLWIYNQNIGVEFGIDKCAILEMKSFKRHLTGGNEHPNKDKRRTLGEKGTYKYLGILEGDTIKQVEMKGKIQKEYLRRTRKLLKTKLSSRNFIKGINTWATTVLDIRDLFLRGPENLS